MRRKSVVGYEHLQDVSSPARDPKVNLHWARRNAEKKNKTEVLTDLSNPSIGFVLFDSAVPSSCSFSRGFRASFRFLQKVSAAEVPKFKVTNIRRRGSQQQTSRSRHDLLKFHAALTNEIPGGFGLGDLNKIYEATS